MIIYIVIVGAVAWGLLSLAGCAETKHQLGIDKCTQPTVQEAQLTQKVWKESPQKWH